MFPEFPPKFPLPSSPGKSHEITANLDENDKLGIVVHLEAIFHSGYGPHLGSSAFQMRTISKIDRGPHGNNHGNWHSFLQICSFPMKIC